MEKSLKERQHLSIVFAPPSPQKHFIFSSFNCRSVALHYWMVSSHFFLWKCSADPRDKGVFSTFFEYKKRQLVSCIATISLLISKQYPSGHPFILSESLYSFLRDTRISRGLFEPKLLFGQRLLSKRKIQIIVMTISKHLLIKLISFRMLKVLTLYYREPI